MVRARVIDRPLAVEPCQLVTRQARARGGLNLPRVGAVRAEDVTAASHSVTLEVRTALRAAHTLRDVTLIGTRFSPPVRAARCGQVAAAVTRLPGPDLLTC